MATELDAATLAQRKAIARQLLSEGRTSLDDALEIDVSLLPADAKLTADLSLPFPAGLAPQPEEITPRPAPGAKLPKADVVVITWTMAENDALADVLTPGYGRNQWYRYDRNYGSKFDAQIREGAPAKKSRRLGSYFLTRIGKKRVLCFKSELHLNQDGIEAQPGQATLPVKDLFLQIMEECEAEVVLTVGTCGGVAIENDLGDVLVTRAARFRCRQEFGKAPFKDASYKSEWTIPTKHFADAEKMMAKAASNLKEPSFGPPTKRHQGEWKLDKPYLPRIVHERGTDARTKLPEFHPILTTDFFEFGTSANAGELTKIGCGLEMGDAALGLAVTELARPVKWAVVRNVSDPQINGDLTSSPRALDMQAHWAVWYYEAYGYWTSVMSALGTWAIVSGLD